MTTQIVAVAIVYNNIVHQLPKPNRHHHVIRAIAGIAGPHQEGFVDSEGNYLSRSQAYTLAIANGQFNRKMFPNCYNGTDLYSEDLW